MGTCPDYIVEYMHNYLDGDISREHEQELKKHLQNCSACQQHMHELSDTIAFVKSAAPVEAAINLESAIMAQLPKSKSRFGMQKWLRQHPFLIAAAVFCLFMSATLFGHFNDNQQFSVTKQPNLVVDGQTVIVPKGEVVKGDIVVRNGDIVVEGEVDGNITVINGRYMASTAMVTGQIDEINESFEWLWYKIKTLANDVVTFNKSDDTE